MFCDNSYLCSVKNLEEITRPVAAELARFEAFFGDTLKADSEPMDSIMRYVRSTRGKRLRPILVLLSARLFGSVNSQTLRAATFVEMVHSATLIHDDVVDDDDLRRGQASVKARWDSRTAVLAGDYLLAQAILLISQSEDHNILQEMLRTSAAMSEGELMQNQKQEGFDYLAIITHKTATLMRSCCATGAMSVGATAEQVEQVAAFGLCFGQLFQMHDDILDADSPETLACAQRLLPSYFEQAHAQLNAFPASEVRQALHDLVDTLRV